MAHKVSIWIRQPVTQKYSKAKPRTVYAPDTRFVLRYHRKWETTNATSYKEAVSLADSKHSELVLAPKAARKQYDVRPKLASAIERYLEKVTKKKRSPNTLKAYGDSLKKFQAGCTKTYLNEIVPDDDLTEFTAHLTAEGLEECSIYSHVRNVNIFLRSNGLTDDDFALPCA